MGDLAGGVPVVVPGLRGRRSVGVRSLAEGPDRPTQALVARGDSRGRAWTAGQGGPKRAALLVAGGMPYRGGLLLYPRLHPWHRGPRSRGALALRHPLHSALDAVRSAADVQASGRGEPP